MAVQSISRFIPRLADYEHREQRQHYTAIPHHLNPQAATLKQEMEDALVSTVLCDSRLFSQGTSSVTITHHLGRHFSQYALWRNASPYSCQSHDLPSNYEKSASTLKETNHEPLWLPTRSYLIVPFSLINISTLSDYTPSINISISASARSTSASDPLVRCRKERADGYP